MTVLAKEMTCRRPASQPEDLHSLVELLRERFPEEVAAVDLSKRENVLRLVKELLNRLWRWER